MVDFRKMSTLTSIMSSHSMEVDEDTPAKLAFLASLGLQPVFSSPKSPLSSDTEEPSHQQMDNYQDLNNAELPGEPLDEEMARLVAKTLLRWKLEAQAVAQAAKEARRRKAIKAEEERQKKREQKKLLEGERKIKRAQEMKLRKELREKQILEAKQKKEEEAANAKKLEAEKRKKEKEMKRVQASMLKQQEKDKLKQQKLDGNRKRKPQVKQLELEKAKGSEEEVTPGMSLWHQALGEVRSLAQLSLCIKQLQKSVKKLHCHLCEMGDNEELLFLCHGCDKGFHTYCHLPKIPKVHAGKWFCRFCVAKQNAEQATEPGSKQQNQAAGEGKRDRDKLDSSGSCAKKAKLAKDYRDWLEMCRVLLAELEAHPDTRPFLFPVNLKAAPWYKRIIKKPMDFSTIGKKLSNNQYLNSETFIMDVNLVFDNCEKYNEDDSTIGRAGLTVKEFVAKRWAELLRQN